MYLEIPFPHIPFMSRKPFTSISYFYSSAIQCYYNIVSYSFADFDIKFIDASVYYCTVVWYGWYLVISVSPDNNTFGTFLRIRIRVGNFSRMSIYVEPLIEHFQDRSSTNNGVSESSRDCACYQCYSIKSLFVIIARRAKDVLKHSNIC